MFSLFAVSENAFAQRLKGKYDPAQPAHFFDYEAVKKVWLTLQTREELDREHDKVWAPFEDWVKTFHADRAAALRALETHPQREAIKRAYDMQLAYEHWFDHIYNAWYQSFSRRGKALKFEDFLTTRHDPTGKCFPVTTLPLLVFCGHVPDWRNVKDKADDQALYAKHAEGHRMWMAARAKREREREARKRKRAAQQ